jgi:GT2 family glycosyltransferase
VSQRLTDWELLILDNGSTDGSAEWLRQWAQQDERIDLALVERNTGYSRAHNRAILAARGEAVLLLNQDVVLDGAFLEAAMRGLQANSRVGSVQGRIGRLGRSGERLTMLDTTGLLMGRDRRVVSRDQSRQTVSVDRPGGAVWGADGPIPLYRQVALERARLPRHGGGWEVLDEDFFAQKEDADLAWRLRRLGWTCHYEPSALAWHARTGGDSGTGSLAEGVRANMANPLSMRILAWRNQRLMQLKNEELGALLRDSPWILRRELAQFAYMLLVDQRRLRAIPALLRCVPSVLRKRRALSRSIRRRPEAT